MVLVASCSSGDDGVVTEASSFVPIRSEQLPIALEADGLGVVSFGDGVDDALSTLEDVLGVPSVDQTLGPPWPEPASSWRTTPDQPCTQATGYKCVNYLRRVAWEQWGLAVTFSDIRGYSRAGQPITDDPHLVAWEQWSPDSDNAFTLRSGVGPGSTVQHLRDAHGTDLGDTVIGCLGSDLDVTELRLSNGSVHVLPGNDTTRDLPVDAAIEKADAAREITFMWAGFHKTCRPPLPFQDPGPNEIETSAAVPAGCGWLGDANIDSALHEMHIQPSNEDSAELPEQWIVIRLLEECPIVGPDTTERVCDEYRLATDPSEIAYRHSIYGTYYADKQTAYHWQNATWTATWMLATDEHQFGGSSVEDYLAQRCPPR